MVTTAWKSGKHHSSGTGYGLGVRKSDRNKYFKKSWKNIILGLDGVTDNIEVNISNSFWNYCIELRSKEIGKWLIKNKSAPWPKGNPPDIKLVQIKDNRFKTTY